MSQDVDERIAELQAAVKAAKAVRAKYRDATWTTEAGRSFWETSYARPNRLTDGRFNGEATLVAFEQIDAGDAHAEVRARWQRTVKLDQALEHLRERHPDAYAELVRWISGPPDEEGSPARWG